MRALLQEQLQDLANRGVLNLEEYRARYHTDPPSTWIQQQHLIMRAGRVSGFRSPDEMLATTVGKLRNRAASWREDQREPDRDAKRSAWVRDRIHQAAVARNQRSSKLLPPLPSVERPAEFEPELQASRSLEQYTLQSFGEQGEVESDSAIVESRSRAAQQMMLDRRSGRTAQIIAPEPGRK